MSNNAALIQAQFAGFDGATVDGRNPKLNPNIQYVLKCTETYKQKTQTGESYFIEAEVLHLTDPARAVSSLVSIPIHYIFDPVDYKKATAWGQLKAFCTAMISQHEAFNPQKSWIHPETPGINWTQLVTNSLCAVGPYPEGELFKGIPFVARQNERPTKKINPETGQPYVMKIYDFWAINDPALNRG